ncbi:MAG TPA: DEAD/DEAH box helicase [Gemmatimonadaceae bacterium]|nr:DEAD/DEAH box helicase [Gemmatimonadaceae bacterium]
MTLVRASIARALVVSHMLPASATPRRLGSVQLHAHQQNAIERLRELLREHRGALLADEAGLGKTYVAAALMREAERPLLVMPASLRVMWRDAMRAVGAPVQCVSYSALSRGNVPTGDFDLVVLDEAHHARTASTLRYSALASLASRSRVLLLSATPMHNRRTELASLFALFLGARAYTMSDADFSALIVRRERGDVASAVALPDAPAPEWLRVRDDAPLLRELLALPPPLPPSDGGTGGVLLRWSLLRQWASSRAALSGALRRRLARGLALEAALEAGRYPNRQELRAWSTVDDAIQLAFPQLVAGPVEEPSELLVRVREHVRAVRALLSRVRSDSDVDESRAQAIRDVRARHPGAKVLVFSQYTDTVLALFAELRGARGVAALTSRGGRIASGALSRQETFERFAPRATGAATPAAAAAIDVLLTTDLASEGLNLHDASVVVHVDLPWTPARLEQRVARSRRLGALHSRTYSYALAPPADAELVLNVERRLRQKLRTMEEVIGSTGAVLPDESETGDGSAPKEANDTRLREQIHRALRAWAASDGDNSRAAEERAVDLTACPPLVACVAAPRSVVLALALCGARPILAAALDHAELTEDARIVLAAIELAWGHDAALADSARTDALARAERWLARRTGARAAGALAWRSSSRRIALRRIATLSARAPHHKRALIAPLAMVARRVVTAPYALGAERVLDEIASAPLPDEAWLRALASFGEMHGARENERDDARLIAVIVAG